MSKLNRLISICMLMFLPVVAQAEGADTGDTAWILTSTALVLFMTLPGLALFYGGLVRAKNVLSVLMQCFVIACVVSVLWVIYGYSIAFGDGGSMNAWIGGLDNAFLANVTRESLSGTLPESVFVMFQMTFAIITPALIVGGFAERMKFSSMLLFSVLWVSVVYFPVCHWVWGGGWLAEKGLLDFAGGTVVHITAGVAALVCALVMGNRNGFPTTPMMPHNMTMTVTGAGMLWVGWFGFNGGSAVAANGDAGMASMVAGLGTITPASGFVGPMGALVIGVSAGMVCFFATSFIKQKLKIDDSLDVFPVHGVGGILGTLLAGIFVSAGLGGVGFADGMNMGSQLGVQLTGVIVTIVFTSVATFVCLKIVDMLLGLRVTDEEETEGLDINQHDERGYIL
jgi:Amt family ammonium transporter